MKIRNKYYHRAASWIALNDDVAETDPDVIKSQLTVVLISDIFDVPVGDLVNDILELRQGEYGG